MPLGSQLSHSGIEVSREGGRENACRFCTSWVRRCFAMWAAPLAPACGNDNNIGLMRGGYPGTSPDQQRTEIAMAKGAILPPERLRQLLEYDEITGKLFWLERDGETWPESTASIRRAWNARYALEEAFYGIDGAGYHQGAVFGRYYKAHRVAWAIHHGEWPAHEIDHVNGDPRDNRIANLRSVSHYENLRNCRRSKRNTSGVTGVSWNRVHGKWQACIRINGKTKGLGTFQRFEDAVEARQKAERQAGYHENHGKHRTAKASYIPASDRL